jgi:hypothetical protein
MLDWIDPSLICRHESCDIEGIHPWHQVRCRKEPKPRSNKAPWNLPAPNALDDAIVRAVSDVRPRHFAALLQEVENDFGTLAENRKSGIRRMHRHLKQLVDAGRVLRIEIGETLFAYLKPTSRVAKDVLFLREQILESIDSCNTYSEAYA